MEETYAALHWQPSSPARIARSPKFPINQPHQSTYVFRYLEMMLVFAMIGLFCFGGGYGILPFIQGEVIGRGWMTAQEFVNVIAVSESTPGPLGINVLIQPRMRPKSPQCQSKSQDAASIYEWPQSQSLLKEFLKSPRKHRCRSVAAKPKRRILSFLWGHLHCFWDQGVGAEDGGYCFSFLNIFSYFISSQQLKIKKHLKILD